MKAFIEGTLYVYFNNDGEGNAVRNAARLKSMIGDP
jgi:uncharacterized protein YecE (DUF72 family)